MPIIAWGKGDFARQHGAAPTTVFTRFVAETVFAGNRKRFVTLVQGEPVFWSAVMMDAYSTSAVITAHGGDFDAPEGAQLVRQNPMAVSVGRMMART